MAQRTRAADRSSATESKLYLPAVITPSSGASRVERLQSTLFSHSVEPPR